MRSKIIYLSLIFALGFVLTFTSFGRSQGQTSARATPDANQDQDQDVRGAFLTTRPQAAEKPARTNATAKPSRRRPRTTTTKSSNGSTSSGSTTTVTSSDKAPRAVQQRLGLGLTLFMRDANGLAVRVDPAQEFHKGDRVRVLLESNMDGHLYIFNTTDANEPVMIYPDTQLDEAGNYIKAHVPFEIPSSTASEERLRWFRFDEHGGTERLYFVFTREPLSGVPIEDELIKYCAGKKDQCVFKPSGELWAALQKEMKTPLQVAKAENNGQAQSPSEHDAVTRGIGLAKDDPEPSLVMMNASSATGRLVAALELVHK
jgi:Domain of unknown function (DUF4384)